jgi:acyl-coenzyme A synthetase/AMP-(fatty) acid ligase
VRDAAIVAFADRRTGVGLYAFVEAGMATRENEIQSLFISRNGPKPPEHVQIVSALPRDVNGQIRTEILQLIAMNQVDLIEPLLASPADRDFMKSIVDERKNLRDRFSF